MKEQLQRLAEKMNKKKVFLGGTCNNSEWRDKLIPQLKINYFNPVVDNWDKEAQEKEIEERENSDYCLYGITPKMKGVYSIAEVVDDSNKRPDKTVLCIIQEDSGTFSKEQLKSLQQVKALVEGNGGKTFEVKDIDHLTPLVSFLNK